MDVAIPHDEQRSQFDLADPREGGKNTELPAEADREKARALKALAIALAAGAVTQALFWRTGFGLNYLLWDLMVLAANVVAFRRAPLRPTAWGAATASALLAFSVVRFESDWVLAVAVVPNLAILAALPILVRDGLTLSQLARVPMRILASVLRIPNAVVEVVQTPGQAAGSGAKKGLRAAVRGVAFGLPTAGLFALLLSSDPDFTALLARVHAALGDAALFVGLTVVTASSYLFTHALHRPRATASDGWAAQLRALGPYRTRDERDLGLAAAVPAARVSLVTWAMVVGQVTAVFALFVAANLRHLFGGAALVRAPGSLTYASYLHAGFGQLLLAATLSVCLVLVGHAAVRPRGVHASAVPGGALLITLESALLVLTGVTLASCAQRLEIYENAYGASHLRLGVAFIQLGIFGVLALTLAKVLHRTWDGHSGATITLFAALAVLASGLDTDAYIAQRNLDRAAAGSELDISYLRTMSPDAAGVLAHPVVTRDSELAAALRETFCAPRASRDWRATRGMSPRRCTAGSTVQP